MGQPRWYSEAADQELIGADQPTGTVPLYTLPHTWCPLQPFLPGTVPPGAKLPFLGERWQSAHLEGKQLSYHPSFSTWWQGPTPDRVVMTIQHRRSFSSHLATALVPPSLAPSSTRWYQISTPLRGRHDPSDPPLTSKLLSTGRLHRGLHASTRPG